MMHKALPVAAVMLAGCTSTPNSYQGYLANKGVALPTTSEIHQCHGYGCKFVTPVTLSESDWADIDNIFTPAPQTAGQERESIAEAVGLLESKAGAQTGTHEDIYGTFRKLGDRQLDCVDESTNTTSYLAAMKQRGLIRFHNIEPPDVRLPLIHAGRWPHQTAVITETQAETSYAVDSWFHDNGSPAEVVTLAAWKDGWKPDKR